MPELPEVHTTASQLKNEVVGKIITDIWSDYHKEAVIRKDQLKDPGYYQSFVTAVKDSTISDVTRYGKNILLHLDNNKTVLIHMKLTGHLLHGNYRNNAARTTTDTPLNWQEETWVPNAEKNSPFWDSYNRFIHLVFSFSDGTALALSDMRRFAKVMLLDTNNLESAREITSLGPDPFTLSPTEFQKRIRSKRSGRIKTVLLDQSVVAGVGNIYSDEALFAARIHPEIDVTALTDTELAVLHKELTAILSRAIETGGDSDGDYRDVYGKPGTYQDFHRTYRKTGTPCQRSGCSGIIERIKVGGRSAHFCPVCQNDRRKNRNK